MNQSHPSNPLNHLEPVTSELSGLEIAVIGMAGRFPGASSIDEFWQNCCNGVESISHFSDRELAASGIDRQSIENPKYVKASGILPGIEEFDAAFFGFTPKEAEMLDPQHRIFFECVWEALEHAGYNPQAYAGEIGVYAGAGMNLYPGRTYFINHLYPNRNQWASVDDWQLSISNGYDFLPMRVSYKLNLRGPSVNVQSSCSTSLVAVHQACQSLLNGECNLALAGAAAIAVPQTSGYLHQEGMILSPDGHCRAFDAGAQGTVGGNGAGVVLLKRLTDALADGDCVHAVIKGSAVNNDGSRKVSFTAPSVEGQTAVIVEAQAIAGVPAETITYVEAHGTGTSLGDPIEVAALTQAFRSSTQKQGFCAIGSVKPNIGHLDTASGIAGLIKTIMALKHKVLPPSINFQDPNPKIDFAHSPFYVNTALTEWKTNGAPRRAGISSLGAGGTNAHLILEEAPDSSRASTEQQREGTDAQLLTLSAKTEIALEQLIQRYYDFLQTHPDLSLADLCYTTNIGRAHFQYRLALVGNSIAQLSDSIATCLSDPSPPPTPPDGIAFLFTGQGSQYEGMGQQLYHTYPVFRDAINQCATLLELDLDKPLSELLYPNLETQNPETPETVTTPRHNTSTRLDQTCYTQPTLFALEYALAQLWRSWGIEPKALLGHSVGEYVAACLGGVFSLADGLKLIAARARLMQALPPTGTMVAVFADAPSVSRVIEALPEVAIAAFNGAHVVLSGPTDAISLAIDMFHGQGVKTKPLMVSHAFHSPLMQPMLAKFEQVARQVNYHPIHPNFHFISTVTGAAIGSALSTPEYWVNHILQPVCFAQALETLASLGKWTYLEVGAMPILMGMGQQCLEVDATCWLSSLHPEQSEVEKMLSSLAQVYQQGFSVDWQQVHQDARHQRISLPTYPFQRQRFWVERPTSDANPLLTHLRPQSDTAVLPISKATLEPSSLSSSTHPLLGSRVPLVNSPEIRFHAQIGAIAPAFLDHHRVYGAVIMPATAYLEMVLAAANRIFKSNALVLENVRFRKALTLTADAEKMLQLILHPSESNGYSFEIFSGDPNDSDDDANTSSWTLHVTGTVAAMDLNSRIAPALAPASFVAPAAAQRLSSDELYQQFANQGVEYGVSFQAVKQVWQHEGEIRGEIERLDTEVAAEDPYQKNPYQFHPVLLDACFQVLQAAFLQGSSEVAHVPISIQRLRVSNRPGHKLWSIARLRNTSSKLLTSDLQIATAAGEIIADLEGLQVQQIATEAFVPPSQRLPEEWLYRVEWRSHPRQAPPPMAQNSHQRPRQHWLILADRQGTGQQLAQTFRAQGDDCTVVYPGQSYGWVDESEVWINPQRSDDFQQLLTHLQDNQRPLSGVVQCWSLDAEDPAALTTETLETETRLSCGSTLHLVQALVKTLGITLPPVWVVTQGAIAGDSGFAQSTLWGMGKAIAREHPQLPLRFVDLDPDAPDLNALVEEINSPSAEDQIAFRHCTRQVARLARYYPEASLNAAQLPIQAQRTYLISGGLGGLGLLVARWLVERGATHLVLIGRSGTNEERDRQLVQLRTQGASVMVLQVDVSQPQEVAEVLAAIGRSYPPLRGIIHAAGVVEDGVITQQTWEQFHRVITPKVQGAWNLHQLTQDLPLDFFLLFSSAVSLVGSAGQTNYCAANAFLDALAHYRQRQGLPALSINWGAWAEIGVAAQRELEQRIKLKGMGMISPAQGLQALQKSFSWPIAQVGVVPFDWQTLLPPFAANIGSPYLSEFTPAPDAALLVQPTVDIRQQLQTAAFDSRPLLLTQHLQAQVAKMLGSRPAQLEPNTSLSKLGLDSLMAIDLRNRIITDLGVDLSLDLFVEGASITQVADLLLKQLAAQDLILSSNIEISEDMEEIRL
jgi:acyl transferase domain-containing protein/aryl carrier-like protein